MRDLIPRIAPVERHKTLGIKALLINIILILSVSGLISNARFNADVQSTDIYSFNDFEDLLSALQNDSDLLQTITNSLLENGDSEQLIEFLGLNYNDLRFKIFTGDEYFGELFITLIDGTIQVIPNYGFISSTNSPSILQRVPREDLVSFFRLLNSYVTRNGDVEIMIEPYISPIGSLAYITITEYPETYRNISLLFSLFDLPFDSESQRAIQVKTNISYYDENSNLVITYNISGQGQSFQLTYLINPSGELLQVTLINTPRSDYFKYREMFIGKNSDYMDALLDLANMLPPFDPDNRTSSIIDTRLP